MPTTAFPGFQHVYLVNDPFSNRSLRGTFGTDSDPLAITRGDLLPTHPVPVRWEMGGAVPTDVVWTTSVHPLIVHERLTSLLREHHLTGWRTYPVVVLDKGGKTYHDYRGLAVSGRCGPVDLTRSIVALSEYKTGWFPHFLGYYFDENSWDGSDLFMHTADTRGRVTGHVFATERVRQVLSRAKVRNLRFERLVELTVSTTVYEIGQPYLLPPGFDALVSAAYARAGVPRPPEPEGRGAA